MQPETEQASTLNNIAAIHFGRKEYEQAIKLTSQAIVIERRNGNAHNTAILQINLGGILNKDKQYAAAEKELLAGLSAIRLVGDKNWEASACKALGLLALAQKQPVDHLGPNDWFTKAEALYREIGDTAKANEIANLLARK
ncbi:MAG: tetratricopeptide repeat protein [Gallionella sp.]|nr:tetratricopeptide repeat protein [Gallionella sp.]